TSLALHQRVDHGAERQGWQVFKAHHEQRDANNQHDKRRLGGAKRACGDNTGPLVGVETDELRVPGVQSFLEELGRSPDHQATEKTASSAITTRPYSPLPAPPGTTSPSIMFISSTPSPRLARLSYDAFAARRHLRLQRALTVHCPALRIAFQCPRWERRRRRIVFSLAFLL